MRRHLSCWNTQYSVDIKKKEEEGEDEEENTTPTHKLKLISDAFTLGVTKNPHNAQGFSFIKKRSAPSKTGSSFCKKDFNSYFIIVPNTF